MFVIMHQAGDEYTEDVMALESLVNLTIDHEIVESLHTIKNVWDIVIGVLFEVAEFDFTGESYHVFKRDMVNIKEVVSLEDFECQELKSVTI